MGVSFFTTPKGEELAVLPRAEFEALAQSAEHARMIADYRSGKVPGLTPHEARALVAAPTPLSFWRKKRELTQGALGLQAGVAQTYISELENGNRTGPVELWIRLARALDVPIESLIDED